MPFKGKLLDRIGLAIAKRMLPAAFGEPPAVQAIRSAEALTAAQRDNDAVDHLARAMKVKLAMQRERGYGGWHDKQQCSQARLATMLRSHVKKGDPVDVANFCAFLLARGEGTGLD